MKKIMRLAFLVLLPLLLASCDVHFGEAHYDVPWWIIAIPVALFSIGVVIGVLVASGKHYAGKKFTCSKCGNVFQPELGQTIFAIPDNISHDRLVLRCPRCHYKGYCVLSYKNYLDE